MTNLIRKKKQTRSRLKSAAIFLILFVLFGAIVAYYSNASALKPPLQGLVDRKGMPLEKYRAAMGGYVVNVNWSELQPDNFKGVNQPIADNNEIDRQVAAVKKYNALNPSNPLRLKLRVYAGRFAPAWVKKIGGEPITVVDETDGVTSQVGRFWLPEYGKAYSELQRKLAAKYDSVAEVADVAVSRCTVTYAEPLIRHIASSETKKNLLEAGYTIRDDLNCQRKQIDSHKVWVQTRSSIALNPYQQVELASDGTARGSTDLDTTTEIAVYCKKVLSQRCILGNNSIRVSFAEKGEYSAMYLGIKELGPPIYFQTATANKIDNWRQTLEKSIGYGANYVELPSGNDGYQSWPISDGPDGYGLLHYNNLLKSNPYSPSGSGDEKNPMAPTGLKLRSATERAVTIEWSGSYDRSGIREYRVYRQKMPDKPVSITKNLYTTVGGLEPGGNYFFYVVAVDNSGLVSEPSDVINAKTK